MKPRHRKVIDEYMKSWNKVEAMKAAGYSESYSRASNHLVFNRPDVQGEIERRQNLATYRSDITLDYLVQALKDIVDANVGDLLDIYSDGSASINFKKLTPSLAKALKKFTVKEVKGKPVAVVEFDDKLRAIELLIRHTGLSKEKQVVEHSVNTDLVAALQDGLIRVDGEDDDGDEQ